MNHKASARELIRHLICLHNPVKAKILASFFKTAKGEYGYGDKFLGITVPQTRSAIKSYTGIAFSEVATLIKSPWHEVRLAAVILLAEKTKAATLLEHKQLCQFYLKHVRYINNWDLVDLSADRVVGEYLRRAGSSIALLKKLAKSKNIWERRVAILATFAFIKSGNAKPTLAISQLLLNDSHDLIHKAVGWMLREVGKRGSLAKEEAFLKKYYHHMPRTMLRYAIERLPEARRQQYLVGKM